jgi:pyruvate dehydrogenase E2 component (dihydrolipoamide acetyltransferase)
MGRYELKLHDIGEGMHEGEIAKWHVKPGDSVEEDQIIVEVQNDKAVVELPSPVKGIVKEIASPEGKVAVVGDLLAVFEVEGAGNAEAASEPAAAKPDNPPEIAKPVDEQPTSSNNSAQAAVKAVSTPVGVLATPSVRKLSREMQLDISQIMGTGRHGQVTKEDLLSYKSGSGAVQEAAQTEQNQSSKAVSINAGGAVATTANSLARSEEERVPLKGIRKVIAAAMVKSVYTAPHVTVMDEVDVSKLVEFRTSMKPLAEKKGIKLTYLPFIVKALVAAARQYPVINASIDEETNEIVYKHYYNIGIATDTDQGLMVPIIADADRQNIWSIASQITDLATRAREGKLAMNEMRGSTVSITNIGSAGGMFFTPVINYPEVAILGTGRIAEKPVVRNGNIEIGQLMALSLSFDHRIIDGATAQHAMNYIKQLLSDPQMLIMEV